MNILALDLGKYKTVFCNYHSDNGEHEFGKVKATPQAIHDLMVEKEPQRVVLEGGIYSLRSAKCRCDTIRGLVIPTSAY
jgi:hypothetical protein